MSHKETYEQLEAYALGALEPLERQAVDDHLDSGCQECLERLHQLGAVAERLADAVPAAEPPSELKSRIMGAVAAERPGDSGKIQSSGGLYRVVALVATAAAVVLAVWGWQLNTRLSDLRLAVEQSLDSISSLQDKLATYTDATHLLAEPGMQFINLAGVAPNDQAFGKVVIDPDHGSGVVYMYELPPTPKGMVYQVWIIQEGKPTSAGMITVAEDGTAMLTLDKVPDMSNIAAINVTIEPDPGMPEPTGMMYLTSPNVLQSPETE